MISGEDMRPGDRVKIRPYAEIEKLLNFSSVYDALSFNGKMKPLCDKPVTLRSKYKKHGRTGMVWYVKENRWVWHEDWLMPNSDFLSDRDFEI
jgi:hypothetical protein